MTVVDDTLKLRACEMVMSGRSAASVARELGLKDYAVRNWVRRHRAGRPFDGRVSNGPKPVLTDDDMDLVEQWVVEDPHRSMASICADLSAHRQREITYAMLHRAMKKRGISCVRPVLTESEPRPPEKVTRYQPHHRRSPKSGYPSSLTDAEWEVLEPVLQATRSRRGRPLKHDPRVLLDAMFYVLRSGCSWRMLPAGFPAWESVYSTFRSWSRSGRMEALYRALHQMWREREGRKAHPSAAIIDSQTVKTTEKGGSADTMAQRSSAVASATSS